MRNSQVIKLSLDKIGRALRVCFAANYSVCIWGAAGWGKSSLVKQSVPEGWGFYDFRLSDKEASDVGGIPYPTEASKGKRLVEYLMTRQLPFDTEERCIVCFEEGDRTSMEVQNAMLQLTLDRTINGHPLSPNARIVLCCNGATDVGTSPFSSAAAGRMVHLYVETKDDSACCAWLEWARGEEISPELLSFAKYKQDVWTAAKDAAELEEYGRPTPRTFVMADRLFTAATAAERRHKKTEGREGFITADLTLPLVTGCVGTAAGREMIGWFEICRACPTLEEIARNPSKAKLPESQDPNATMGVYFALGMTIAKHAKSCTNGAVDAYAVYLARWPKEQARFAFTHLLREQPRAATAAAYLNWEKTV